MVAAAILAVALQLATFVVAGPLAPNELGRLMILEYHKVDYPEQRWTRTPENFRKDLETLYARGYRLIHLDDFIDGRITTPAGTTPVVLTFDDSSPGQFHYLDKDGVPELDPKCAVAVLEAFSTEHPDFGHGATFYVLPGASKPNRLFNQPEYAGKKLQFLVSHGYEIGNHTLWHANLGKYDEPIVREQIAQAEVWIHRLVPDYKIRTIALPLGVYPKEITWALQGSSKGTTYAYDAILEVSGGPAPSPFSKAFDAAHLPRIQAIEPELTHWLTYFDRHPEARFVSDGDPEVVTVPAGRRDVRKGLTLKIVER